MSAGRKVFWRFLEPTSKLASARTLDPRTCSSTLTQEFHLGSETPETELDKIVAATNRAEQRLEGEAEIGLRVGKVLNRFKLAKHFELSITDTHFSCQRKSHTIETDAQLDGLYVIRTSVSAKKLSATAVVQVYKNLSRVEQAFRCLKTADLKNRPIFHHLEPRVRAHVFICFLAYYVEWHMRQRLAPMLFEEGDPEAAQQLQVSIVDPAKRSKSARKKAGSKQTPGGDQTVNLWTVDGDFIATLNGHTDGINGLDFSPDGQFIVSASDDRRLILWDLIQVLNFDQMLAYG